MPISISAIFPVILEFLFYFVITAALANKYKGQLLKGLLVMNWDRKAVDGESSWQHINIV